MFMLNVTVRIQPKSNPIGKDHEMPWRIIFERVRDGIFLSVYNQAGEELQQGFVEFGNTEAVREILIRMPGIWIGDNTPGIRTTP